MSGRRRLGERLQAARAARFVDLPVPDVDGVFVRYGALPARELEAISSRYSAGQSAGRKRRRDSDPAVFSASVDVLVEACVGVWELDESGDEPRGVAVVDGFDGVLTKDADGRWQLDGALPTFSDPELGAELGVDSEDASAGATVRALYVADGDVIGTADAIVTHSGTTGDELLKEARGN